MGSAAHQVIAGRISGRTDVAELIDAAQTDWNVYDGEELAMLCGMAWNCWRRIEQHFPNPQTEVEMKCHLPDGTLLTSHVDVLSVDAGPLRANIVDWKTGRLDQDHTQQIKAYAWSTLKTHPHLEEVYGAVVRVRTGEIDGQIYTRQQLDRWALEFVGKLASTEYNPGDHCRYCPRLLECPAVGGYLRLMALALYGTLEEGGELDAGDPDRLGDLMAGIKGLMAVIEPARDRIRDIVASAGGLLDAGKKWELAIKTEPRKKIAASPETLQTFESAGMTRDEWYGCLTVGKTKAETALKAHAPRGQKGKVVEQVLEQLDAAGQMSVTFIEKIEIRRKPEQEGA